MKDICLISSIKIDPHLAFTKVAHPDFGGTASFMGVVRQHNLGRDVVAIEYDVFDTLTVNQFQEFCREARERWGDALQIYIEHVKGKIFVGDISLIIAVGSVHRKEALAVCQWLIEQIKHRAPIWKKEYYTDGETEWVQGHALCQHA